jgi:hypothetical protein
MTTETPPKRRSANQLHILAAKYRLDAELSHVDIVLVRNKTIFLLVEVEEHYASPKTILGDVFGVLLSERFRVKGVPYPIKKDATMIVAMIVNDKRNQAKRYMRLERHLNKYLKMSRESNPTTGLKVSKLRLVTSDSDDLVRRIERLIRLEIGKQIQKEIQPTHCLVV